MNLERDARPSAGPRFFEQDGVTMFEFVIDAGNVLGPRPAKKADREDHAGAWQAFNQGRLPQLDHDGDGAPGGSKPIHPVGDEHKHVPADYEAKPRRGRPPKPKE